MNEDYGTGGATDRELEALAAQPLDRADEQVLAEVARMLDELDPVPPDLVERLQFSLALGEMFAEVAQIVRMPMDAMAVRSEAAGTRTESLTFSAQRLSAMVTVTRTDQGVRVDGWLAPGAPATVRIRMRGEQEETEADESGRFVFEGLREGFAQLSFQPLDDPDTVVVTPVFEL